MVVSLTQRLGECTIVVLNVRCWCYICLLHPPTSLLLSDALGPLSPCTIQHHEPLSIDRSMNDERRQALSGHGSDFEDFYDSDLSETDAGVSRDGRGADDEYLQDERGGSIRKERSKKGSKSVKVCRRHVSVGTECAWRFFFFLKKEVHKVPVSFCGIFCDCVIQFNALRLFSLCDVTVMFWNCFAVVVCVAVSCASVCGGIHTEAAVWRP